MLPKGFPVNLGELPSPLAREVPAVKGDRRRPRMDGRAVLRPHSTVEGGELQGSLSSKPSPRGGHDTRWREGVNNVTYLPKET